jgi:hypothetical protein
MVCVALRGSARVISSQRGCVARLRVMHNCFAKGQSPVSAIM